MLADLLKNEGFLAILKDHVADGHPLGCRRRHVASPPGQLFSLVFLDSLGQLLQLLLLVSLESDFLVAATYLLFHGYHLCRRLALLLNHLLELSLRVDERDSLCARLNLGLADGTVSLLEHAADGVLELRLLHQLDLLLGNHFLDYMFLVRICAESSRGAIFLKVFDKFHAFLTL